MLRRGRGRNAAIAAAFLLGAVLLAALGSWKELLLRHHLARIRRDPGSLLEIIDGPDGWMRTAILERHFESPKGKRDLRNLLESEVLTRFSHYSRMDAVFVRVLVRLGEKGRSLQARELRFPANEAAHLSVVLDDRRYSTIRKLLPLLGGEAFVLPGRPDLAWRRVTLDEVMRSLEEDIDLQRPHLLPVPDPGPHDSPEDATLLASPRGGATISALAAALKNPDARYHAARALEALGPEAQEALPSMERLLAEVEDVMDPPEAFPWASAVVFRRALEDALRAVRGRPEG